MPSWSVRYRSETAFTAVIFFLLFTVRVSAQEDDYETIFGSSWQKAETFISGNEYWLRPALEKNGISYPLAVAVIFPEIVRYNALRDRMETVLLKTLYINLGDQYADFSIGIFQMKPSFAEKIRAQAPGIMGRKARRMFSQRTDFKHDWEYRSSIVNDLEDPEKQVNYLIALIKICESRFNLPDGEERVKFLSTAYNYSFDAPENDIRRMEDQKFFNTKLYRSENYSYADVALYWYRKHFQSITKSE